MLHKLLFLQADLTIPNHYKKKIKALNIFQINLIQTLKFMHKTKCGTNPRIFLPKFRKVDHQHPTRFSQKNSYYKRFACKTRSFAKTVGGPTIWNRFLGEHEESLICYHF